MSEKKFNEYGYGFEYVERLNNCSLAEIYNTLINRNQARRYIILDHDSQVNNLYLKDINYVSSNEVGMPRIYVNNNLVNPCINMSPIEKIPNYLGKNIITTIGSGLVVGSDIASFVEKKFGNVFDERFVLYGVDTTFCYRINTLNIPNTIKIINGFEHSLSRLEVESENVETLMFRKKERSCDLGLRIRYYSTERISQLFSFLLSSFKRLLLRREQQYNFFTVLSCMLLGKHIKKR
ncbi:hypothetical protein INS55_22250 [Raoultella terrigena]|nr:hypothetical protein [Raoultella terrigena]